MFCVLLGGPNDFAQILLRGANYEVVHTLCLLAQPSAPNLNPALPETGIYRVSSKLTVPPLVAFGNKRPINLRPFTSPSRHDNP